ncbi:kinase-like protein [Paraphaeosphaeria sporulosa]|uniref:Kinase-like protein n=1 Tax=Paraphaeosphaeria sporulosa TaxID=1460663 RepID=A0A177CCJ9_9PLEO|nr:kinase-like protein [Paraphaeosphaeria sporulosa]OAG04529.1 kinase-like protein [Paraphaeosphaeria sporulosa]
MTSQQGGRSSPTQLSALAAPRAARSESHSHSAISSSSTALHPAANATSSHLNAALPPLNTDDPADPSLPRFHIRNPSAALSLNTDVDDLFMKAAERLQHATTLGDGSTADALRHSATAPIAIQEGYLRSTFSAGSMTGSLSPGSALSSPALNALVDLTPLPSPLVMSDSPGSWTRGGVSFRPRSRGASGSSRDDSFAMFSRGGTLSPSPSLKKKGYQKLKTAGEQAVDASMQTQHKNDASRERNRSLSEFRPDSMHNIGARHVTISNVAPQTSQPDTTYESRLHREAYLAAQRGLVPATVPAGLPTPPASNRSVTESEEDEIAEHDKVDYITVRQGPQMVKKLWRPVRQLGQGTFSKVWLATSEKRSANDPLDETTLDPRKLVAIKVVEHGPAGGADEERVELSLKREVEMLRSVSHPSLVHLRAFDNGDSQALLVLTYCPGGDLFDVASTNRDLLGVDLVQRIYAELVSATRYLHEKLIVHRDIKLENVLLNIPVSTVPLLKNPRSHPYPIATLTDLGLSRRIPAPPESPLLTTRCGSEDYAAPEILLGQPYDGRQTDAWALGVLLYALMEGRLPFDSPPGKPVRSRPAHRIARCDWMWIRFGDDDGEWDAEKGEDWEGARACVEGLLKKVSRGRKSLEDIEKMEWVQNGIQVDGGVRRRIEDYDRCP